MAELVVSRVCVDVASKDNTADELENQGSVSSIFTDRL